MEKNVKTKILIVIAAIVMIITATNTLVMAAEGNDKGYSVNITASSDSKLKAGDVVTVKLNLQSVNAGGMGINSFEATIKYDTNVFEELTQSDFQGSNPWAVMWTPQTNYLSVYELGADIKDPQTMVTINFKVKSSIDMDSTIIGFESCKASNGGINDGGTGDIDVNNISITIDKEAEPVPSETQPENTAAPSTTTPTNTAKTPTTTSKNVVKDNTVTKTATLPKTGIAQYSVVAIVVIAIIAIFSYVLYKKTSKDVK